MSKSRRTLSWLLAALLVCGLALPVGVDAQTTTSSPGTTSVSLLVKVVSGLSVDDQAALVARNGGIQTSAIPALNLIVVGVNSDQLATVLANYQADPQVVSVEQDQTRRSESIPSDLLYNKQWALAQIGWDTVFGAIAPKGTATVAILDTGVDARHPDLKGNVVPGTSILDGSDGTTDPTGHGTALAGVVAALTDNSEGIAGVGYAGVQVMPVTVLDVSGLGKDSDIIAGVVWAADHGADVIVMAFSATGFSSALQAAIDYAWSKNVVLVGAVGNDKLTTPTFPAGDRGVMGVSATDQNDNLATFSNSGQAVFLGAPGVDIQTTYLGDAYTVESGTSLASAIVAGVAAFMRAVDPTLTNGVIVNRIASTADPAGAQDQTGNGRINMARALASTSTDSIQPAGAAPVGDGGPFVGPYKAATVTPKLAIVSVTLGGTGITSGNDNTVNVSQSFTVTVTIKDASSGGSPTWTNVSATLTVPSGWTKTANMTTGKLGTASGTSGCTTNTNNSSGTNQCTYTWTVTPNSTPTSNGNLTVNLTGGTPSTGNCTGSNCTPSSSTTVNTVLPAALSITKVAACQQNGFDANGNCIDTILKSGDTAQIKVTVANTGGGATALNVKAFLCFSSPDGNATLSGLNTGAGSANTTAISSGQANTNTYTFTAGVSGNGTLTFTGAAKGTDENSQASVKAGDPDANPVVCVSSPAASLAVDNTAPVLTLPSNITAEATSGAGAVVTYSASANDAVSGSVAVSCDPPSGSTFPFGPTTVNCSATDQAGNTANGSFTVTVQDTTPPAVTVPSNITAEATGPAGATVTFSASALDIVDGSITPNCIPASGSTFPLGSTTVTCSATDAHGNTGSGSFAVTVQDTTPPVLSELPNNITQEATSGAGAVVNYTSPTASDLVDGSVAVTCNPVSGSTFALGTTQVTCSATDAHNNTASGSFNVTVQDTAPPVLSLSNITVNATSANGAVVDFSGNVSALDSVSGSIPVSCVPASGSLFPIGNTSVACSATDGSGNTANGSFTVNVVNAPPVANDQLVATIEDTPADIALTASDVDSPSLTFTVVSGPSHGSLSASSGQMSCPNGAGSPCTFTVTYTPAPNYNSNIAGDDSFTFKANDGILDSNVAAVTVHINPVNDAPIAGNDGPFTTPEDQPLTIQVTDLLANDAPGPASATDESGQTLTVIAVSSPSSAGGTVVLNNDGTITYTPLADYNGPDSFSYTIRDNGVPPLTASATVSLTVTEVNDPPVAVADSKSTNEDTPLSFPASDLTANDSKGPVNESGQTLTVTGVSASSAQGGTVVLNNGTVTYTPPAHFHGSDSFTYTVCDNGTTNGQPDPKCAAGTVSVTVAAAVPVFSPINPASQSVQYSDPIVPVSISASSPDPLAVLVATATGLPAGITLTGEAGAWTLSGKALVAPGTYPVTITVSDFYDPSNSSFTTITITVTREDARTAYTGATFVGTQSATSGLFTATLSATIQDITAVDPSSDPNAGDIRNATVRFVDRSTNQTLCGPLAVGLVSLSDSTTGTVTCNWSSDIGTADGKSYTIGIVVESYYTRNDSSDNQVVQVSKPLGTSFITGGGYLVLSSSSPAGQLKPAPGSKNNFGFNVKYNKSGTNLQGQANIIVRSADGRVYQIKSNAITSLSVNPSTGKAQFNTKASIQDVTNPATPFAIDGGAILQLNMTDKGEPGQFDTIGITAWNKNGGLWFSSNWTGTTTAEQTLGGGNLVVH